ncbi:MAG: hypothetical protein KU37_09975 [Sulfuricurvum sp. PC08-66]|nr:MAG: hypothetical protein KU37_09975 [Sulfuricurvum sp. PC08-66]
MRLVFLAVMLLVVGLMLRYIYARFLQKIHFLPTAFNRIFIAVLALMLLFFMVQTATHWAGLGSSAYTFFSFSIGIIFILFVMALLYDITHTLGQKIPFSAARRNSIKLLFDSVMIIIAVGYMLRGIWGGMRDPMLKRVDVKLSSGTLHGLRIVQLTDVHIGHSITKAFVESLVVRINALESDIIVITGDLIDAPLGHIEDALKPLEALRSRWGVYFVLGNHDYFYDTQALLALLPSLGIEPLLNSSRRIDTPKGAFNLVGINDLMSKRAGFLPYDVDVAFSGVDSALPTIVLAHQPKMTQFMTHQKYDLVLSGHTHGGQIFPFGLLVLFEQPYLAGLYRIDETRQIYVSRGTGYWGPAIRVLAPSELTLLVIA